MTLKIAIQADEITHHNGERQSYSDRWFRLAREQGITAVPVDAFDERAIAQIAACDAFMWRYDPAAHLRLHAQRLLRAVEEGLRLPVFPNVRSAWHFEDKIGQYYCLKAAGIPTPESWIFWKRDQAVEFCRHATYPFVLKLATGYQASNVRLIHDAGEALYYVDLMFTRGVTGLGWGPASAPRLALRRLHAAEQLAFGHYPWGPSEQSELQFGYFFAQEFLPGNGGDTRITLIGDRAFGFRRFNRPNDFRASGSGRIDWAPEPIDERAIRLAWEVGDKLRPQAMGVDIIRRGADPVVVELNLAFASWAVRDCPGHWVLHGDHRTGTLEWVPGSVHPEDAIFNDFVAQIPGGRDSVRQAVA